jgi:hypothetical protein
MSLPPRRQSADEPPAQPACACARGVRAGPEGLAPARWLAGRRPRAARTSDGTPSTRLAPGLVLLGTATRLCTSPLWRRRGGAPFKVKFTHICATGTFARPRGPCTYVQSYVRDSCAVYTYYYTLQLLVSYVQSYVRDSCARDRGARTSCMHGSNHRSDGQVRRRRRSTS